MSLRRLSALLPPVGAYAPIGAMQFRITLYTLGDRDSGSGRTLPPSPWTETWAAIGALQGQELDKAQQIAQGVSHLVKVPWQLGIAESMTIWFDRRRFQIKYVDDMDERRFFLNLYCAEIGQNAAQEPSSAVAPSLGPSQPISFSEDFGPPVIIRLDGDIYYNLLNGDVYEQRSGTWSIVGNIPLPGGGEDLPSLTYHKVSAAGNNADLIKGSPGKVMAAHAFNDSGATVYVKLYDQTNPPNPAINTPLRTLGIEAGLGNELEVGGGLTFVNGIAIAIVKGIADNDNMPVAAGDCVVDISYQ